MKATTQPVEVPPPSSVHTLWAGLLLAPTAFLLNLQIPYMLVTLECSAASPWLFLSSLVALGMAAVGASQAWGGWRRSGGQSDVGEGGTLPQRRFMAMLGLLVSALFATLIVAQTIPMFILGPCMLG